MFPGVEVEFPGVWSEARVCGAAEEPDGEELQPAGDGWPVPQRLQEPHQGHRAAHQGVSHFQLLVFVSS